MRSVVSAFWLLFVLIVAGLPAAAQAQGAVSTVLDVRLGDHGDKTRFVLDMTAPLDFRIFSQDGDPQRLVIDFPPLEWRAEGGPAARGLIAGHGYTLSESGTGRIVLDLTGPARVKEAFFLPASGDTPYRFVLDLEPAGAAEFAGQIYTPAGPVSAVLATPPAPVQVAAAAISVPLPPAAVRPTGVVMPVPAFPLPRRRPETAPIRVIAIDPGHGGLDPGAIGVSGIHEKDITLSVSRTLRDVLEATGRYRVFLTRDTDAYLKLRERVALARGAGADLFLSIHADSIGDGSIRGASVYTLSEVASDREAELLAARENRADALAGVQLDAQDDVTASILIDLAQRLSQNESKAFAERLVASLDEATKMLNNPHRQAGFAVLKAPDVPSVLLELGYLSNEVDESRLRSDEYQEAIARGIAQAIDSYFGWLDDAGKTQVASGGA